MNALGVGVTTGQGRCCAVISRDGEEVASLSVPDNAEGAGLLRVYLQNLRRPLRFAVSSSAFGFVMALGDAVVREVMLVASPVASQPAALARIAERML
ncbi:hypothetical protein [Uliginosibacterium sp. H1]|uniref:hypothetical protein n=1 Tax=Uliginosibacterium sp. H1 TaxID=3114757 RepID=UPI002E198047|nr:hypothetical protein [Uliginosibacterium sp. H1]